MSTGDTFYDMGESMSGPCEEIIKSCAIAIAPPALTFGLSVQALATSIYMNQCNPGDMVKAGGSWIKFAEKNWEALEELGAQTDRVDDDNWKGEDAEAFKGASRNVGLQLGELAVTATLIGVQLIALGFCLAVYWVFLLACAVVMEAFLVAYVAAYAGVATAVGAESIRAGCLTVATSLCASVKSFEAVLKSISTGCAAMTGAMTAFTFGFQKGAGNPVSPVDIAGSGLTDLLIGLGTYAERALTMTPGGRHASVTGGAAARHGVQSQGNGGFGLVSAGGDRLLANGPDAVGDPGDIKWTD
ncbi:hypothetical protein L0U85_00635 [Glycomyces sp. L485]|uniref:hypothetical protein n=1 Tax=Glycomyces sp. L485 TaxID=2909235 RepID=UPI001F4A7900|nr:hypothetical protein [Glycomyces sp. L485]MCH7229375.1 hypothetical protein [Glycomyces sp. L485]